MAGVSHVFKIREMKPIERGPGLRGWPLVSGEKGSQFLTTGITEFQVGAGLELHTHNCEEQVTILEGDALAEINGVTYELTAPDTTFISLGLPHRFINRGSQTHENSLGVHQHEGDPHVRGDRAHGELFKKIDRGRKGRKGHIDTKWTTSDHPSRR